MEKEAGPIVLLMGRWASERDALAAALLSFQRVTSITEAIDLSPEDVALSSFPSKAIDLPSGDRAFEERPWVLDNKYYTAQLRLWVGQALSLEVGGEAALAAELRPHMDKVEGAILCFDPSDPQSLEAAKRWATFLAGLGGLGDDGLQLLVALCPKAPSELGPDAALTTESSSAAAATATAAGWDMPAEQRMALVEWGLDHGYEFVEVESGGCAPGSVRRAALERDKEGVARVVEAAEVVAWSRGVVTKPRNTRPRQGTDMSPNPPPPPPAGGPEYLPPRPLSVVSPAAESHHDGAAPSAAAGDAAGEAAEGSGEDAAPLGPGAVVLVRWLDAAPQHNGRSGEVVRFDPTRQRYVVRLHQESGGKKRPVLAVRRANLSPAPAQAPGAPPVPRDGGSGSVDPGREASGPRESSARGGSQLDQAGSPPEEGPMRDIGDFESLIEEVRRVREDAARSNKQEGGGLQSDEVRRARAAETALKLLEQIGGADGDEDDGD